MGMSDRDLAELALGAVLYDHKMKFFGMTDRIGPLDPVETEEMRGHTFFAYDALKKIYGFPSASALVSCQHHERFNGSGYPKGIKGESISVFSRITAAADVYDSMMSNRPYRDAFLPEDAWDHIVNNGDGIFDPVVVSVFEKTVGRFLPGDIVSREGDAAAVVAGNNFLEPERPEIKLIEKKVKSDIIACPNGEKIRTIESIR
jgi:HD-GYP domain-containing protein (c-di-GMP phosphodiesterase class II)